MLQTQTLKLNVSLGAWKSTALFTLSLDRGTSPSLGLFSAEIWDAVLLSAHFSID